MQHGHTHHEMMMNSDSSHCEHEMHHTATGTPVSHMHMNHGGHMVALFRKKFWVSLVLTTPVLLYSTMVQEWLHVVPPRFVGSSYIPFIFATVIFFYGGIVFIQHAAHELRQRQPGMMTLISLAVVSAYAYSVVEQVTVGTGATFFWELATLITIMLLGHWLEMASVASASSALDSIASLLPNTAEKIEHGTSHAVPLSDLHIGDQIRVRPGTNIPVDGIVIEGTSSIDEAAITGESQLVRVGKGSAVIGGTGNQDGTLTVRVTKLGDDTVLAGIMKLVHDAEHSKSHTQVLADKAAFVLTVVALVSGVAAFIYWLLMKDLSFALERMVTVFITACPHALGLAIPLVVSISTTIAARNGLLIRKRLALEAARSLDWVLFDKTGTLTSGQYGVTAIASAKGHTETEVLSLVASLESGSEHVVGYGIVAAAKKRGAVLQRVTQSMALPGVGIQGEVDGKKYLAVSRRYVKDNKLFLPTVLENASKANLRDGNTEVYLIREGHVLGLLALSDTVREESKQAVQELQHMGVKVAMITGDSTDAARRVARELGIKQYFAEVEPADKAAKVMELQKGGQRVAMVGDGINDAPALMGADVGIAIGAGTDIAIQSADIVLIGNDPRSITKVIALSKRTYTKMVQNLIWATAYNVVTIPLAAGVLQSTGFVLSPAVGALIMSVSTIVVALNAQLLRRTT